MAWRYHATRRFWHNMHPPEICNFTHSNRPASV
jgi:hypothetical protein